MFWGVLEFLSSMNQYSTALVIWLVDKIFFISFKVVLACDMRRFFGF